MPSRSSHGHTSDGLKVGRGARKVKCRHLDPTGWCTRNTSWCYSHPKCKLKVWVNCFEEQREGAVTRVQ